MFRFEHHMDTSLRFYGEDFCVVARRDGSRHSTSGQLTLLLRELTDALGVNAVNAMGCGAPPPSPDLEPAAAVLRLLFERLDSGVSLSRLAIMRSCPGFFDYVFANRIPLLGLCEITHRCNLECEHCYVLHKVKCKHPAHIDEGDGLRTIESMARLGCLDITISGGEPTLHKSYRNFIARAKDLHLHTALKTNGTTMNPRNVETYACDPAHETHLSLYGATAAVHDEFTQTPDSFERSVAALRELGRNGIQCHVFCIVWTGNATEVNAIADLCEGLGHKVFFSDLIHGRLNGDPSPLRLRISSEVRQRLIREGRLEHFEPAPCVAGKMKVKVSAEGRVSLCELLPQNLGDAFKVPLENIWHRPRSARSGDNIVAWSLSERENGFPVRSCPGLNWLERRSFAGRTEV